MDYLTGRIRPILAELKNNIITDQQALDTLFMQPCGYHCWDLVHAPFETWPEYHSGDGWGGPDHHVCFQARLALPTSFDGRHVVVSVSTGRSDIWNYDNPQFLVYLDDELVCGLDVNHTEFDISRSAQGGREIRLAFYGYCHTSRPDVFMTVILGVKNDELERFYYDLKVPFEVYQTLPEDDKDALMIAECLHGAVNRLDLRQVGSEAFFASVRRAGEYLQSGFYQTHCGRFDVTEHCIGHTHIDVAWLWPLRQTREKVLRSFANVLYLMDRYPEFKFMSSQPQLYDFVKQDCPAMYERIKQRVAEGRWEAEGGMWLEADCNLTSGESLVRQILHGKRFFRREFGSDNVVLWLPDVFGYSAALPQILAKSGIRYFMTTKIAWNDTNRIPNDTMRWRGIDGTEILTHFITTRDYEKYPLLNPNPNHSTTYNGMLTPGQVKGCWQRYQNKAINRQILQCYGNGDGGGGPTGEMLENARRMGRALPGCPKVVHTLVRDYFELLEQTVGDDPRLPVWCGELYLEFHRGTYTSMARNKRDNRLAELRLAEAELFAVIAALAGRAAYPREELERYWKLTLLNQFHDILPGSSIGQVYEDSKRDYEEVLSGTKSLIDSALAALTAPDSGMGEAVVAVFNPGSWQRTDIVRLANVPFGLGVFANGESRPSVRQPDGSLLFLATGVPPKGVRMFRLMREDGMGAETTGLVDGDHIVTVHYDIRLDDRGHFCSIYDRQADREVLQSGGRGNVLQVFEDRPAEYEAWNIDRHFEEKMWEADDLTDCRIIQNDPLCLRLRQERRFLSSVIIQEIVFYHHSRRIDFETVVDWKESHLLLKVAFPVDITATKATYEIQYGNVERPTHRNTSWDKARFEVCAHKWADLSEGGYGVTLLNDCKYGYDIHDSVLRLSLIKCATYPNPAADREIHRFTYSLYPHNGDFRTGQVIQEAYALNCPLYARLTSAKALPDAWSAVAVGHENVVLEVVKQAEEDERIILRLYEAWGCRTQTWVRLDLAGPCRRLRLTSVDECNLLEESLKGIPYRNDQFSFEIRPYEIKTFALTFT